MQENNIDDNGMMVKNILTFQDQGQGQGQTTNNSKTIILSLKNEFLRNKTQNFDQIDKNENILC